MATLIEFARVWRRRTSESLKASSRSILCKAINPEVVSATTSGTKDRGENLPLKFKLYQNYPNPFNPNTTIRFTLKQGGFTKLEIFNELGSKIKDLINQYLTGGNHDVEFNASDYVSGVYYYKLASSNFTSAGKMIYLK